MSVVDAHKTGASADGTGFVPGEYVVAGFYKSPFPINGSGLFFKAKVKAKAKVKVKIKASPDFSTF